MLLEERVQSLAEKASKLKAVGQSLGEAHTKVAFIQPLLETLGWDVSDPGEVTLEYPVFGGTLLDYALLIDGQPSLYLEAKKLAASMNDPAFISQTVNYANNDGIRWCVLTNGLVYRIYKSDELASADKKLLAEADLREASDPDALAHVVKTLSLLSKASLAKGDLDEMGERVLVDVAVRSALDALVAEPSAGLVNLIRKSLSDKDATKQVKASLARIPALSVLPKSQPMPAPTAGTAGPTRGQGWTIDHHLDGKPQATVDLYQQLDTRLVALGNDISRKYLKWYVNYQLGKRSVVTVHVWQSRVDLFASMPFWETPQNLSAKVRDVTNIGHLGLGNVEYRLSGPTDIDDAMALATASYVRAKSKAG